MMSRSFAVLLLTAACYQEAPEDMRGRKGPKRKSDDAQVPEGTWLTVPTQNAPIPRSGHKAIWTGSDMLVWGGSGRGNLLYQSGASFSAKSKEWSPLTLVAAPSARREHSVVWTGQEMLVWGGLTYADNEQSDMILSNSGCQYDPITNDWHPMALEGAPEARRGHAAVWTGNQMMIWGGLGDKPFGNGALYSPNARQWDPTPSEGAPSARYGHSLLRVGERAIVWGGFGQEPLGDGAIFDPAENEWTAISQEGAPEPRRDHTAVWIAPYMIVWGGQIATEDGLKPTRSGAMYHVEEDRWVELSIDKSPSARIGHTALSTGSQLLIWGGHGLVTRNDGALFDPQRNTWFTIKGKGNVSSRTHHTAVWTGNHMIVWGGIGNDRKYLRNHWIYGPPAW